MPACIEYRPSSIEKEIFEGDQEEQKEKLKTSAQMKAYREYREKYKDSPWNPDFHYYSPDGIINDPNGLCFWKGRYHIFYQAFPPKENPDYSAHRVHWGHAVSTDLVHWKDLPLALYPDLEYACYSGATLAEEDRVVAIYHGRWKGTMIAYAKDPLLLNWEKEPKNPVIPLLPDAETNGGRPYGLFDPYLWKDETGYYSLSGCLYGDQEKRGLDPKNIMVEQMFTSKDLKDWTYIGELAPGGFPQVPAGNDGACPYFVPFGDGYALFNFSHLDGAYLTLGGFDKTTHRFYPERSMRFNHGPRACSSYQAPCAMSDGNGGAYVIFNTKDAKKVPPRNGAFSLMYHMTPGASGMVRIDPAEAVDSLHEKETEIGELSLKPFTEEVLSARGNKLDIQMRVDLKKARALRLRVLRSDDLAEYTDINIYMSVGAKIPHNAVTIDTLVSSLCPDVRGRVPETACFDADEDGTMNLRVVIDKCMIEVFANHQNVVMQMVYPSKADSNGVSLTAMGSEVQISDLKIWSMGSIYDSSHA